MSSVVSSGEEPTLTAVNRFLSGYLEFIGVTQYSGVKYVYAHCDEEVADEILGEYWHTDALTGIHEGQAIQIFGGSAELFQNLREYYIRIKVPDQNNPEAIHTASVVLAELLYLWGEDRASLRN